MSEARIGPPPGGRGRPGSFGARPLVALKASARCKRALDAEPQGYGERAACVLPEHAPPP